MKKENRWTMFIPLVIIWVIAIFFVPRDVRD